MNLLREKAKRTIALFGSRLPSDPAPRCIMATDSPQADFFLVRALADCGPEFCRRRQRAEAHHGAHLLSGPQKELELSVMDVNEPNPQPPRKPFDPPLLTLLDAIPEFAIDYVPPPPARHIWGPLVLFVATCATTFLAGTLFSNRFPDDWWPSSDWCPAMVDGLMYSGAVMTILLCHEMGHFLQALRYGVYASLPYFLPMPLPPIGTFGAVIRMDPRRGDRKAIFDIGISGPLAGLVPTMIFLLLGIQWSHIAPIPPGEQLKLGEPLLMQYFIELLKTPIPAGYQLVWHPIAVAGWVGLLITSINLVPIGQLDGGHILYGMFRKKANLASLVVLALAVSASIRLMLTNWWLMLGLVMVLGTSHPPTADDSVPLGIPRYVLGILVLAFLFFGFTPIPLSMGP
jgi:membrane-associated protease RseP (regulator of RpoE activity)